MRRRSWKSRAVAAATTSRQWFHLMGMLCLLLPRRRHNIIINMKQGFNFDFDRKQQKGVAATTSSSTWNRVLILIANSGNDINVLISYCLDVAGRGASQHPYNHRQGFNSHHKQHLGVDFLLPSVGPGDITTTLLLWSSASTWRWWSSTVIWNYKDGTDKMVIIVTRVAQVEWWLRW